jgi:O-antigen biosynthesis alpha-1,2-rhamnosyltransferase
MRLLFDCTNVFWHPGINSGIQRVVRNIIGNLPKPTAELECLPVVLARGKIYHVRRLMSGGDEDKGFGSLYRRLARLRGFLCGYPGHLRGVFGLSARACFRLFALLVAAVMLVIRQAGLSPLSTQATPLAVKQGDQLVLLDSTWQQQYFDQVEKLKACGTRITAVVYDIIPLTNPGFFPNRLRDIYANWFAWVVEHADGFACISKTVRDEVRLVVKQRRGREMSDRMSYSYFHLGSELDLKNGESGPPSELLAVFATDVSVFLAVGTIEPRKNHAYLLDAFDALWGAGSEAKLCLVGSSGWKCEDLLGRITTHSRYGKSLFWFKKLGDDGLEYAYRHANALIMSSHAEGFGLPIVEALQRGLPVMASDIPVFREIGSDFVAYFDLANPRSLVDLVQAYERTRAIPGVRSPQEWRWIDWKDSAKQLVEGVISGAD